MSRDPFKSGRFYHLPTFHRSLDGCGDWDVVSGGLRQTPIAREQFYLSLTKALRSEYQAVVLPSNSVLHEDFTFFVREALRQNIQVIYQIPASWLHRIWAQHGDFFSAQTLAFEIILDDVPGDPSQMEYVKRHFLTHFTIPGLRSAPVWQKLRSIPYFCYSDLHFYFPYHGDKKKLFKPAQVMDLFSEIKKINPDVMWRAPLGLDIYEPRIEESQDLEPLILPLLRRVCKESPQISVVIPAFNNGRYLVNTLRHLEAQNLDKENYEVIVVDDGSHDDTGELTMQFAHSSAMAMTVLHYPRSKKRQMGDSQFRAGLARNLGVKWASGNWLVFLDADIIVPQHFLAKTLELHRGASVVQWRRDYLNQQADSTGMTYERVTSKDCFVPEDGYWHEFYQQAEKRTWMNIQDHWKYVCTYALSLPRKMFKDLGWFRKTYCFYGFEDTDLGLRLAERGEKFYFHNEPVYHLFHETDRSEFQNSPVLRQKLLKNTAKIFFHNNLSPDIYRVFKYLLREWF